jgi:UrcA family protein
LHGTTHSSREQVEKLSLSCRTWLDATRNIAMHLRADNYASGGARTFLTAALADYPVVNREPSSSRPLRHLGRSILGETSTVRNIIISAVAVLALSAASVQARSLMDNEVVVHYGDLNVATPDGAKALYTRVQIASAEICGYQPSHADIAATQVFKACSVAAQARAIKMLPFDLSARIESKVETVASR